MSLPIADSRLTTVLTPRCPLLMVTARPACHPDRAERDPTFSFVPNCGASGRGAEGFLRPLVPLFPPNSETFPHAWKSSHVATTFRWPPEGGRYNFLGGAEESGPPQKAAPTRARETQMHRQECLCHPSKVAKRSLDYATRRARLRRGGENRVAPLGMTLRTHGRPRGDWW